MKKCILLVGFCVMPLLALEKKVYTPCASQEAAQKIREDYLYGYYAKMNYLADICKTIAGLLPKTAEKWVDMQPRNIISSLECRTVSGMILECINNNTWSLITPLGKWQFMVCPCQGDGDVMLRNALEQALNIVPLSVSDNMIGSVIIKNSKTYSYYVQSVQDDYLPMPEINHNPNYMISSIELAQLKKRYENEKSSKGE